MVFRSPTETRLSTSVKEDIALSVPSIGVCIVSIAEDARRLATWDFVDFFGLLDLRPHKLLRQFIMLPLLKMTPAGCESYSKSPTCHCASNKRDEGRSTVVQGSAIGGSEEQISKLQKQRG